MNEICGDNRFEIIAKAKADLLEGTNIETDEAEMAVLDNILFRCWQMGWLDRYDRKTENSSEKPNNCDTCKHNKLEWYSEVCDGCSKAHSNYEPKDEPQTCSFSDCDNFKNPDYERCIECKRKQIKLKTEQTERSSE